MIAKEVLVSFVAFDGAVGKEIEKNVLYLQITKRTIIT